MNDEIERPCMFNLWPDYSHIRCPECDARWMSPHLTMDSSFFCASSTRLPDERQTHLEPVFCPACGVQYPPLTELAERGLVGISPTADKPFVGTVSGIQKFLKDSAGCAAKLWDYRVSHSYLTLKIDSKIDSTHAFIVCIVTSTAELPRVW